MLLDMAWSVLIDYVIDVTLCVWFVSCHYFQTVWRVFLLIGLPPLVFVFQIFLSVFCILVFSYSKLIVSKS